MLFVLRDLLDKYIEYMFFFTGLEDPAFSKHVDYIGCTK